MYKKILVTGGSGLVGAALDQIKGEYPDRKFIFVGSKDCDLVNMNETMDFIKALQPDAILHLAAVAGGIAFSTNCPATHLRDNVLMNIHIVEAARINNVKKIVMSLSTGMYPAKTPNPILEEYMHNGYPHETNYSYAFAKRLVDPMIKAYRKQYGMNIIGLIPNGIFGENVNYRYDEATMLPALIRRFYENREGDSKIIVWGDGSPLRELTYGKDMARAYMWCLDNYDEEQVLHIGTTEEVSVKEVAYMVADLLSIDKKRIEFDTSKPAGQFKKSTDNSKFVSRSGFKYTPFEEGLKYTVQWFCEHYSEKGALRL